MAFPRIQNLPDDFDEARGSQKDDVAAKVGKIAAIPGEAPPLAGLDDLSGLSRKTGPSGEPPTFEEMMKQMSKSPLFMNEIDVKDASAEDNPMLEAMRALQYEGTRLEIAHGFKDQGNELTKTKHWKDGREFYTKAVAVLLGKVDVGDQPLQRQPNDEEKSAELRLERSLLEICYVNRALCQLEIGNYRSTILDCAAALTLNPGNAKAFYRSAQALLYLARLVEAKDACDRGLVVEPTNIALKRLSHQIEQKSAAAAKVQERRQREKETADRQNFMLLSALKARGIKMRGSQKAPDLEDAEIHLDPDPEDPTSSLVFPAIFLYPMHAQSDFIKAFSELESISDHLEYILPPPWDEDGLYRGAAVDCFMDTSSGGLVKVGKKLSLLNLLSDGKVEILDGLVKIHVIPSSLAPKWIAQVKSQRNK